MRGAMARSAVCRGCAAAQQQQNMARGRMRSSSSSMLLSASSARSPPHPPAAAQQSSTPTAAPRLSSTNATSRSTQTKKPRFIASTATTSNTATSTTTTNTTGKKHHSTTSALDFTHSCPSILIEPHRAPPPRPSAAALRTLFVASAVPMVGFGAMDNFVMIQAGQYIDSTLGVQLGLATMTAAAAGQVVSDVSGVVFGGTLERMFLKLSWIRAPALTARQRQLPVARNVAMLGAVVGVIVGCALGATTLLLVDLEARDRLQRAARLREIVSDMIATTAPSGRNSSATSTTTTTTADDGGFQTPCTSCVVYIADDSHDITLTPDDNSNTKTNDREGSHSLTTRLKLMKEASSESVRQCADTGGTILSADRRVLHVPVIKREAGSAGETMAVVAFQAGSGAASSASSNNNSEGFTEEDVVAARVMARHIAIFMDRFAD